MTEYEIALYNAQIAAAEAVLRYLLAVWMVWALYRYREVCLNWMRTVDFRENTRSLPEELVVAAIFFGIVVGISVPFVFLLINFTVTDWFVLFQPELGVAEFLCENKPQQQEN